MNGDTNVSKTDTDMYKTKKRNMGTPAANLSKDFCEDVLILVLVEVVDSDRHQRQPVISEVKTITNNYFQLI